MIEKRKFLHLECTFNVEFIKMNEEQSLKAQIKNVNTSGICIVTNKPLPGNLNVFMKFFFPDRSKSYNIEGRTIWTKQVREKNAEQFENGIEFLHLNNESNALISDNVINLHMVV